MSDCPQLDAPILQPSTPRGSGMAALSPRGTLEQAGTPTSDDFCRRYVITRPQSRLIVTFDAEQLVSFANEPLNTF